MSTNKIFLNKKRDKFSTNKNSVLCTAIHSDSRALPIDKIDYVLDEYQQYLKEKTASNIYRLSFIINPICSNILFNHVSEIVYKEGSDECIFFGKSGSKTKDKSILNYHKDYKGNAGDTLNRYDLIRDTAYSHKDIGGIVYHCGYDIFNNHTLRKKEFNIVNRLGASATTKYNFNTISDLLRDYDGKDISEEKMGGISADTKTVTHMYTMDTIDSFEKTINNQLVETDGWIGFINPTTLDIPNYVTDDISISINKCMNNNKPNEFIDMYPDRSLYSFIPKINKYRNGRTEHNWDYCLTYPSEKFFDNDLVSYLDNNNKMVINGLKTEVINLKGEEISGVTFYDDYDNQTLTFKTDIKNNLASGSTVEIILIVDSSGTTEFFSVVENVKKSYFDKNINAYCFEISGDDVIEYLNQYDIKEMRLRQIVNGGTCEYYFRKFKKIPNVNRIFIDSVNNSGTTKQFNSTLNKMGFSRNIYRDTIAQLLFNDDIDLSGLKDNLGRKVGEIFLTIVKNNQGYKEWYGYGKTPIYNNSSITFSHCFGEVTSGVDIKSTEIYDYNIHKIHNVPTGVIDYELVEGKENSNTKKKVFANIFKQSYNSENKLEYSLPKTLESNITVDSKNEFLGDIVEFSPYTIEEVILENVYHRFNTAQREWWNGSGDTEYSVIYKDEILIDDYDIQGSGFRVDKLRYNEFNVLTGVTNTNNNYNKVNNIPANIDPEGYYYKPHYSIKLREYYDEVKQGKHTQVVFMKSGETSGVTSGTTHTIMTSKSYYLETHKELYLYKEYENERIVGIISKVEDNNRKITISAEIESGSTINDYIIYKPNTEMPEYAYDLMRNDGIYLWRDENLETDSDPNSEVGQYPFANNAHYINKNITFFLRRQDPTGYYKLSNIASPHPLLQNLAVQGYENDYSLIEIIEETIEGIC